MSHTLNMWGAVIGLLAAVAWVISAVSTIPPLVLGAGGQTQLNSDLVRWIQDTEKARRQAGWWNSIAAFLTAVSAVLLSGGAMLSTS